MAQIRGHVSRRTASRAKDCLTAQERRDQLVRMAVAEFAKRGLHATTTDSLAKSAGISQPVIYLHFPHKEALFREAVQRNSAARAEAVERRIASISVRGTVDWIEHAVTATVTACLSTHGGPRLMNWALLELPDFGADVHRHEVCSVAAVWEREISLRTQQGSGLPRTPDIGCAVQVCYPYAFWLDRSGIRTSRRLGR